MPNTETRETPRDRIRSEILNLTKRDQQLSREIGSAVVERRDLGPLRRERRKVRQSLDELHCGLNVLASRGSEG